MNTTAKHDGMSFEHEVTILWRPTDKRHKQAKTHAALVRWEQHFIQRISICSMSIFWRNL